QPEAGLYIAGMKSYGRAPTLLMLTGYEQVRSIACALTGDHEGARDVRLVLPDTGVRSTNILADHGLARCVPAAGLANDDTAATGVSEETASVNGSSEATVPVAAGGASCCGPAAPQVIQLTASRRGGCC